MSRNARAPEISLPQARAHRKDVSAPGDSRPGAEPIAAPASCIGLLVTFAVWIIGFVVADPPGQNRRQEADLAPAQPPDRGVCVHRHGAHCPDPGAGAGQHLRAYRPDRDLPGQFGTGPAHQHSTGRRGRDRWRLLRAQRPEADRSGRTISPARLFPGNGDAATRCRDGGEYRYPPRPRSPLRRPDGRTPTACGQGRQAV